MTGIWIDDKATAIRAPQAVIVCEKPLGSAQVASDGRRFKLMNIRNAATGKAGVIQVKKERIKTLVLRQDVANSVFRGFVDPSEMKGYVKVECVLTGAMDALERNLGTTRSSNRLVTQARWLLTGPDEYNDLKRVVQA